MRDFLQLISFVGMRRRLIYGKAAGGVLKRDPNKAEPHRYVRDNLCIFTERQSLEDYRPILNTLCIKRIRYNPNLADSSKKSLSGIDGT